MAYNTFTSGVNTSFSTELNGNFRANKILQVYSSTGFDVSVSSSTTVSASSSTELTAIASSSLGEADYIIIRANVLAEAEYLYQTGTFNNTSAASLKIEAKEIGGAYSDSLAKTVILQPIRSLNATGGVISKQWVCVEHVHTLTAGQKSNGVQFRITGYGDVTIGADPTASDVKITNKQVIISTAA